MLAVVFFVLISVFKGFQVATRPSSVLVHVLDQIPACATMSDDEVTIWSNSVRNIMNHNVK